MIQPILQILMILALVLGVGDFELQDAGIRFDKAGGIDYSPDCTQKVYWWDPDNKEVGGDLTLIRETFSNSFLKEIAFLSLSRSNVPIQEAESVGTGEGKLTLYFLNGEENLKDVMVKTNNIGDPETELQESSGSLSKDVVKKLLEQTQDVRVKVEGTLGSYEQVIPLEVIQEFSEFYTECLK
jgi:hypothetical protein